MWEQSGEYSTAIDLYLQLTTQNCSDNELLQNTWEKVEQSYIIFCRIQILSLVVFLLSLNYYALVCSPSVWIFH